MRLSHAVALIAASVVVPRAHAQVARPAAADSLPAAVADAFFHAAAAERWREAAGYLDLARFDAMRREHVAVSRRRPPFLGVTADELLRHDPDMPRAAAEYQVRKMIEAQARAGDWIAREYAGVPSADSLARLPTEAAAARWLEAQDARYHLRQAVAAERAGGCVVPPELATLPAERPRVILGTITRDGAAYVLHTAAADTADAPYPSDTLDPLARVAEADRGLRRVAWYENPPAVLVLRPVGGAWRIVGGPGMLSGGMGGVALSVDCARPARSQ